MLTFHINLYCLKAYHRTDRSICIVEEHTQNIPKSNIFTETQTQGSFQVCDHSFCNIHVETKNFVPCTVTLSCLVSKLQKPFSLGLKPRTDFQSCGLCSYNLLAETNNFVLRAILLSCLVSKLKKTSSLGIKPRTVVSVVTFVPVVSPLKQKNFVLVAFFYRA
jgi:hypothetical protein